MTEEVGGRSRVAIDGAAPHTWCDEIWATTADDPGGTDPGDCVVQRGTNHAWRNHGDQPIRLLTVMVGTP